MIRFHFSHYILAILFVLLNATAIFYPQSIKFNNLTVENGLSNNDVNTLIQDKTGFIWFGTEDGLNRYDGYNFKVFRHNPTDSNSLSNNSIWALLEDRKGNIWIGTKDGKVNIFNPIFEKFSHIAPKPKLKDWNSITALYEDKSGNIWIGTRSTGVYEYNPESKEFTHYPFDSSNSKSLSHFSIRSIVEDQQGNIIIGTYRGLNKLYLGSAGKKIEKYFHKPDDPNSLSHSQIYNLTKSHNNSEIIWIGTPTGLSKFNSSKNSFTRIKISNTEKLQFGEGASTVIEEIVDGEEIIWTDTYSGLVRINITTGSFHRFTENPNDPGSLINDQINKVIKDRSGVIWIATENGVSFYSPKSTRFNTPFDPEVKIFLTTSRFKSNLRAAVQDRNKNVWLGFSNGLISIANSSKDNLTKSIPQSDKLNIWSLSADSANSLWIGTYGQGLKQFDLSSGEQKSIELIYKRTNERTAPFIKSLFADSKNNLWIGYWGSGLGFINNLDGSTKVWRSELGNPKSLNFQDVWSIKEDGAGRIWIGTPGGGLNLVKDINNDTFEHWVQSKNDTNLISSNSVFTVCVAKNYNKNFDSTLTVLWIGTNNGLNKFSINGTNSDPYNFKVDVRAYTIKDGLSDNTVNSIIEDDEGNLWLGTGSGISFFNLEKESFINFNSADGLNGTMMNSEAAIKLDNGLMIFGSTKGLNVFNPVKIKPSNFKPAIVITDFQIFNKSVSLGENSVLKQNLNYTEKTILTYDQNVFSIEFAALDYNSPQSIQYTYKMEGFDEDWLENENRRFVTYTNLNPGKYIFKVKSTNADGVWNDETVSLEVIIDSPWWATLWAYGFYTILIVLGLLAIRKFELNRTKLRNELRLREFEAKHKSQLEEMKSRFFANLSHEFRTPLTLIKGPVELLKNKISNQSDFEQIEIIERNSEKLQELIDQLLELSQLENSSVPLKARKEDLINVLKGLLFSFDSLARQKNIGLKFQSNSNTKILWIDRDKLEKIINNLLSNALKFTPTGGSVTISVNDIFSEEKAFTEIIVSDTGIGIPENKLENIFDRFYQVDDSTQRSYGGSGIGLALVKELVDLHKWKITVESGEGKGANFKLMIPLSDDYLDESEKVSDESLASISKEDQNRLSTTKLSNQIIKPDNSESEKIARENKDSLLIVEDSADLRAYLSSLLKNDYVISEAANGEEGIKTANEILPDIIISDVMMPSMDGFEFCRQIKSDWHTSDIPIILLTAKASFESKLEGLEIGADDYLTKPFDSRELFVRIINLLEQRKRIREKYSKDISPLQEVNHLNSSDKDFTKQAYDIVEMNLDKTNFSTDQLAKELFLSRSQLHRKMISITGQAPGEFIRIIKLKRAAEMLLTKKLSVTQIAYEIGFSSPAQFSRAFSRQFNCTPSEYSSKQKA
jgi:signal transduction histidine kinase/ligand-binding sensor domain-containing protein/DNA-binding response OmpR family regulator